MTLHDSHYQSLAEWTSDYRALTCVRFITVSLRIGSSTDAPMFVPKRANPGVSVITQVILR